MKTYIKPTGYLLIVLLASLLILTIFNYFNVIVGTLFNILLIILPILSFFIGGIMIGKRTSKKGWLSGLKMSLFIVLLFIITSLMFRLGIKFSSTIYFLILISSSMFGSMLGIQKRKPD